MIKDSIQLKNSSLNVSRLCFGGCPMGRHGWGNTEKQSFVDAINLAVKKGVNFFDTADVYGLGEAEKTLGETVKSYRDKVVIATKFGVRNREGRSFYDNSPDWIEEAINQSLERLQTKYIDIYQIHNRDSTPFHIVMEKLLFLKKIGKIRYIGLSNIFAKDIEEIKMYKNEIVSFQDEFSLANRTHQKDIQLVSKKLEITPMTWGSLGQGILTGKYNLDNTTFQKNDRRSREIYVNFHGKKLLHNLKIVEELKNISSKNSKELSAIAIRWILDVIPSSVVLAGIKNVDQLLSNIEGLDWSLNQSDIDSLSKISLNYE
jgi:aryl-alcohol dehydrogenase-like predicted oxidoreductase